MAPVFKLCFPALLLSVVIQAQAEDKTLNLYSWADYVPAQTLQRFEQETGIHVRYDTFDTSEVLETKLLTGGSGYDVVVPSSSVLARGLAAGALKEIPHEGLKGYANLDPDLLEKLAAVDPGNRYAVPYTWGTLGAGVERRGGEKAPAGCAAEQPRSAVQARVREQTQGLWDCRARFAAGGHWSGAALLG